MTIDPYVVIGEKVKIQNNVKIMVPPFINQGDTVSIDCHTREYIKKAN